MSFPVNCERSYITAGWLLPQKWIGDLYIYIYLYLYDSLCIYTCTILYTHVEMWQLLTAVTQWCKNLTPNEARTSSNLHACLQISQQNPSWSKGFHDFPLDHKVQWCFRVLTYPTKLVLNIWHLFDIFASHGISSLITMVFSNAFLRNQVSHEKNHPMKYCLVTRGVNR